MSFGRMGSLGKGFGRLGASVKAGASTPPTTDKILLADGTSYILQTDGTSKVIKAQ